MRHIFIPLCTTGLALTAVACGQQVQSDSQADSRSAAPAFNKTVIYICDETQVKANFYDGFVDISMGLKSYNLPRVPVASGEKYERKDETDSMMFRSKGDRVIITLNDQDYPNCTLADIAIR